MCRAVLRSRGDRARQPQAARPAVDAWNERGANPGQKILPIKATATGPAMAPPAPPRPAWPYQHSAAAAFRRQCATPLQQDSAELSSTVAPVFSCHLSTSPRPRPSDAAPTPRMTSRSGEARPRGSPSSSGLGPSLASVAVPPLTRHLCPPITGITRVRSGVWSVPASLTGPRLTSVRAPSKRPIDRSAA